MLIKLNRLFELKPHTLLGIHRLIKFLFKGSLKPNLCCQLQKHCPTRHQPREYIHHFIVNCFTVGKPALKPFVKMFACEYYEQNNKFMKAKVLKPKKGFVLENECVAAQFSWRSRRYLEQTIFIF